MPVDLRLRKLAKLAVNHSIKVKKGENIIISGGEDAVPFLVELYKEIVIAGGFAQVRFNLPNTKDFYYKHAKEFQLEKFPEEFFELVKKSQGYIGINSSMNTRELTNSNPKKIAKREKLIHPIREYIVNEKDKIRRVTICYPSVSMAQDAEMSLNEYEQFVYLACLQDWGLLRKKMQKIANKFSKGKEVHLIGKGVDLKFSIKGKNVVVDDGCENMPGGEIFMAPVRESLEGWIKFDYPRIVSGKQISGVYLKFKKGKIIEATSEKNQDFLNELIKSDENSSYIGEFGIGLNQKVNRYTNDLLFDEKMDKTIHLAIGSAYEENGGGNDSCVHVDIVKDMKNARIVLDGKTIQENGIWKV